MDNGAQQKNTLIQERPDVKYVPCQCCLLNQEVWAIASKQRDGTWKVVNCLDKDEPCFHRPCAFTTDGGQWPFAAFSGNGRHPAPEPDAHP